MKRLFRHELAIITTLCVVGIFLFPVAVGPYSAVHGPVTALLAFRAAMKLYGTITLAAVSTLALLLKATSSSRQNFCWSTFALPSRPENVPCLRC
ncbi:MAG TPA: hypothetical protein VJO35_06335 [Terriglobales bacterium]|nr:hypothetical protein [Terriglobales bacterium]